MLAAGSRFASWTRNLATDCNAHPRTYIAQAPISCTKTMQAAFQILLQNFLDVVEYFSLRKSACSKMGPLSACGQA